LDESRAPDLTALLALAGIDEAGIDAAAPDDHPWTRVYLRMVEAVAAGPRGDLDRAVVAAIVRGPDELAARTAIVHLVDTVATTATRPTDFQRWAAFLAPELDHLTHYREFLRRRIHDWTVYLTIASGHVPRTAELAGTTDWMQRTLATTSTSPAVLTILAGTANTRKTRNIARNRMNSRAVRDAH
jgi:hypothetical protein